MVDRAAIQQLAGPLAVSRQVVMVGPHLQHPQGGGARLRARVRGGAIQGALATVPGEQLLVQDPGERHPLPPCPIRLLQEHEVVVRLAQAGVFLLVPPAEEELGTLP